MAVYKISPEALRMAWKMVDTILPHTDMSPAERDLLLNLTTLVALGDLLNNGLRWTRQPEKDLSLRFRDRTVVVSRKTERPAAILRTPTERETEAAIDDAEELFDCYRLEEEERAALFTALPCLGLHALRAYLEWTSPPPFPELGGTANLPLDADLGIER